jgi:hypothetical protein
MSSTDSGVIQKVDAMLRIARTACSGFGGRHAPDSLVAFHRITHIICQQRHGNSQPASIEAGFFALRRQIK